MEREACVCDHGFEGSDFCAEIILIIINFLEKFPRKKRFFPNNGFTPPTPKILAKISSKETALQGNFSKKFPRPKFPHEKKA